MFDCVAFERDECLSSFARGGLDSLTPRQVQNLFSEMPQLNIITMLWCSSAKHWRICLFPIRESGRGNKKAVGGLLKAMSIQLEKAQKNGELLAVFFYFIFFFLFFSIQRFVPAFPRLFSGSLCWFPRNKMIRLIQGIAHTPGGARRSWHDEIGCRRRQCLIFWRKKCCHGEPWWKTDAVQTFFGYELFFSGFFHRLRNSQPHGKAIIYTSWAITTQRSLPFRGRWKQQQSWLNTPEHESPVLCIAHTHNSQKMEDRQWPKEEWAVPGNALDG